LWATAFAAALNFVLVGSFIWPELVARPILTALWLAVAIAWLAGAAAAALKMAEIRGSHKRPGSEDLFRKAQDEYLKGDWYEAEAVLQRLLQHDPHDAEAQLMLAALYRHTGRTEEARRQLKLLSRLEKSQRWQLEIQQEYRQLNKVDPCTNDSPIALER